MLRRRIAASGGRGCAGNAGFGTTGSGDVAGIGADSSDAEVIGSNVDFISSDGDASPCEGAEKVVSSSV